MIRQSLNLSLQILMLNAILSLMLLQHTTVREHMLCSVSPLTHRILS
jgi:hypothetical protein